MPIYLYFFLLYIRQNFEFSEEAEMMDFGIGHIKMPIQKILQLSFILVLLFTLMPTVDVVRAATCSGGNCEGKNPNTTGCDVGAYTVRSFNVVNGLVENRRSAAATNCETKWVRTRNTGSQAAYAAARLWVDSHYTSSPAPIGQNAVVYTTMHYPGANLYQYCGLVSLAGPIAQPMTSPCGSAS